MRHPSCAGSRSPPSGVSIVAAAYSRCFPGAGTLQDPPVVLALNRTSTGPADRPFSATTCSRELYDQLLLGSDVPFTDTAAGARAA